MFASCSHKSYSVYEKIAQRYLNMPSYEAKGKITIYTNKTENKYEFVQYYDGKDKHLLHYTDDNLKIYFDKDSVHAMYPSSGDILTLNGKSDEYMYMFPDSFFEKYYVKETSALNNESGVVILETEYDTDSVSCVKLHIDRKSVNPLKMEVYDSNMTLLSEIIYDDIIFNVTHDEKIFAL